jgi:predicted O-methyltransferase YrrM
MEFSTYVSEALKIIKHPLSLIRHRSPVQEWSLEESYGTHRQFLEQSLRLIGPEKNVLEIGMGFNSTAIFRSYVERNSQARCISVENSDEYFVDVQRSLGEHVRHQFNKVGGDQSWFTVLTQLLKDKWGLVFIDSSPWDSRTIALLMFRSLARIVVVHDVDYYPHNGLWGREYRGIALLPRVSGENELGEHGVRCYCDIFSSWVELFPTDPKWFTGPPTLVGSNFLNLDEINWEYAEHVNLSKNCPCRHA